MYLFTRAGQFAPGSLRESMGFVTAVTEKVRQETGLDVHVWGSTLSPEVGTTVWATFVEDLGRLEEANDKLATSDSFTDLADRGARLFVGPLTDGVAQVVAGARDLSGPVPNYIAVARATAANGQVSAALANGVEIAATADRITGGQTMFLVDVTGPYGGCRWSTGYADIGELERAESALLAHEDWLALIDRVGPSYTQDARQAIYRRLD